MNPNAKTKEPKMERWLSTKLSYFQFLTIILLMMINSIYFVPTLGTGYAKHEVGVNCRTRKKMPS
jgi:K+-transporting ATPase A subunit